MKRIVTILVTAVLVVGLGVSPATAHDDHFTSPVPDGWLRNIECPHPYLVHPEYGPWSLCTFGTHGVIEDRAVGYYSPITNDFMAGDDLPFYDTATLDRKVMATDGHYGTVRAGFAVGTSCCGPVRYGMQYIYYLGQPIGRFGQYSLVSGKFHPDLGVGWLHVERNHGI